MPVKIVVTGSNAGNIKYVYSADGIKLQKRTTKDGVTTTTDYAGNFVYENGDLKQISHPEGYIEQNGNTYQYVYYLKDFWGNTRVTFADTNGNGMIEKDQGEIKRTQDYYPFGLEHANQNNVIVGVKNNLKTYQGQEFTEDLGLNTHEWKFRISDPAIGRFWQIDPLAEKYTYNSTYAFQENKLGKGIELEGLEIFDLNMSFKDNLKLNYHAAKSFVKSVVQTGQVLSDPIKTAETVVGIGKAIASPKKTLKAIASSVSQTAKDLNSTDPKVKGEAFGKTAAFITETMVGAELANATKVSKVASVGEVAAKGVTNTVSKSESVLGHIFRDATGHVNPSTITSQNRYVRLFEKVANNSANLNPNVLTNFERAAGGFQGYSQTFRNGQQVWARTLNGNITNAGVNIIPK